MPLRKLVFARSLQTAMALIVTVSLHANLFAADKKPVAAQKPGPKNLKLPGGKQLEPHLPLKPETKAEKAHREALAWYMQGRLRESSGDFRKAYIAYQKAVALEPTAISIYRALVPLAFGLGKQAEGVKYAFKAIELDPNDYKLLRQLGVFMAAQNKIPQAAKLLEQATQSKTIDKSSIIYVTLMRDLAILYSGLLTRDKESTELKKKSADAYFVVFDARTNPKKYKLNDATQRRLETDPISSFERIGTAFLTASRPNLAIHAFEAAQKERKGKPGSLSFNLAQVYHKTKQNKKAMKHLQLYFDAQLQTKGKAAYALLSDILKAQGQSKSLVGKLEAISKKDRKNSVLQFYLAEQYVAAKQLKKAGTLFRSALKINESSAGRIGLAAIHREQNQSTQWLQELATVLRGASSSRELDTRYQTIQPEVTAAVENKAFTKSLISTGTKRVNSKKNPLKFEESFILGQLAAEAKQTKQAVAFYEFSLQTKPSMAGTIYEEWGGHLLVVSKYKESVVIFRKAVTDVALSGQKPNFLFRLSQAEESAGNTKSALAAIREAQQIIPNIAFLHYQEGWIYYHARQWDKAIPLFEGVISRFATDRRIVKQCRFSLSNIYVQQGNRRKGEQILEQVYAEDPEDPSVNNDLGYLYAERGKKLEQAEKMIRKALKAEPKNAAYMDSMGWVLYMQKKYTEALPYLEKSAKDPSGGDATIWDHLGDCYNQLKKSKEAKESWQKALKSAEAAKSPDKKLIKKIKTKLKP